MNRIYPQGEPLVSIITLNYNQAEITRDFLESSRKLLYSNYEILVCDMASPVSPDAVFSPSAYPHTRLLRSDKNLGFSGGNNWGIRQAKGSFIFIVNNDTELTPDLIGLLLEPFYQSPAIGVVCPKIKYFEHRNVIQYAGFRRMNPLTGRTSTVGDGEADIGQYPVSGPTHAAHGCAMMVKKEVIDRTGMFPEQFFLYYEEWDWSARILRAGYLIWYQAAATIYHRESASVGKDNPLKIYYHTRNRILYMRRNSRPVSLLVFTLFFTFVSMPKAVFRYLLPGDWTRLRWFFKAVGYNLVHSAKDRNTATPLP